MTARKGFRTPCCCDGCPPLRNRLYRRRMGRPKSSERSGRSTRSAKSFGVVWNWANLWTKLRFSTQIPKHTSRCSMSWAGVSSRRRKTRTGNCQLRLPRASPRDTAGRGGHSWLGWPGQRTSFRRRRWFGWSRMDCSISQGMTGSNSATAAWPSCCGQSGLGWGGTVISQSWLNRLPHVSASWPTPGSLPMRMAKSTPTSRQRQSGG